MLPTPVTITRHHVDVHGRDVHYRRAGHGPPVVLLHASPRSSASLLPLLAQAPAGVTAFAFDTPGCGDSAPLALAAPDALDFGAALGDTLAALGIARAPVYGTHTGAAIALGLAVRHPERVAALVLDGLSVFSADECARWLDGGGGYLPPFVPRIDGSHLAWLWSRVRDQHFFFPWNDRRPAARLWRPPPTPEQLHAAALDLLRAGDAYRAPYEAAFRFQPPRWLAQLEMPVLVGARPDDVLLPHLERLGPPRPNVRTERLPADPAAGAALLWRALLSHVDPTATVPPAADVLPRDRLGGAFVGRDGARIHLRGAGGGPGRPRLLLHDSPGHARALDAAAGASVGQRPVLAPDLPSHGDSDRWTGRTDASALAQALHATLSALGIDACDVEGTGAGGWIAAALAAAHPARYRAAAPVPPSTEAVAAGPFTPRLDGGHLMAAWQHAYDEAVLGPLWTRSTAAHHDFGSALDAAALHRACVGALLEAPDAASLRRGWLREAAAAD